LLTNLSEHDQIDTSINHWSRDLETAHEKLCCEPIPARDLNGC
jgi:hypothetical protein